MVIKEKKTDERVVRDAVQSVLDNLLDFDKQTRQRILRTVATFFDIDPSYPTNSQVINTSDRSVSTTATREHRFGTPEEISPKDFLYQKQPKTDLDRVACLAYYLTHFRNSTHFKTVDISKLNTEAAQMKFSNAAYSLANAANAGLLASAGKGKKQLSALGEKYVEALPDYQIAREIKSRLRRKRTNKKIRRKP